MNRKDREVRDRREEVAQKKVAEKEEQKRLEAQKVRETAQLWTNTLGIKTTTTTQIWTDEDSWGPSLDWGGDTVDSEDFKTVVSILQNGGDIVTALSTETVLEAEKRMQYYFDQEEATKAYREAELVRAGVEKEEAKKIRDNAEQARLAAWQASSMRDVREYANDVLNKGSRRGWIRSTRTYRNLTKEAQEYLERVESIRPRWNDRKYRIAARKEQQAAEEKTNAPKGSDGFTSGAFGALDGMFA